jgi:hypothetical protein
MVLMPRQPISFNGPAYEDLSSFMSGQESINCFLRPYPDVEGGWALVGSPGLEEWVDLGTGEAIRGQFVPPTDDYNYVVSGNSFFRVSPGGIATEIGSGTIVTNTGNVSMDTNGNDVTIVDGVNGYVYDISADTLTQITDADFPGGTKIKYIAGYYFVNKPNSQEMHQGAWNDGLTWPGYFDSAGQAPDNVIDLLADHAELMAIGSQSLEPWYNAGAGNFILRRRPGAFIEQGTVAVWSSDKADNGMFWLGRDKNGQGQVFQSVGLQPSVISTPAIKYQISKLSKLSDAIGFCYEIDSQTFYVLIFPNGDKTFIYDISNAQWHERSSVLTTDGRTRNGRWRVNNHVFFNGNHIVGDFENGKLYKLKSDVYDEDGTQMIMTRTSNVLRKNQNMITVKELQILMEPGVGLTSGQGEDPYIMLSWSVDGGFTFGNEIPVKIGKKGKYANRAITPPLGQGRNWVFKARISDPVKRVILGAFADIEVDRA